MFEWPKLDDLKFIRNGQRIPSLQVLTISSCQSKGVGAISVNLSNGMKSEEFKAADSRDLKQDLVKFSDTAKIKQIKAVVQNPMIFKLCFVMQD